MGELTQAVPFKPSMPFVAGQEVEHEAAMSMLRTNPNGIQTHKQSLAQANLPSFHLPASTVAHVRSAEVLHVVF